MAKSKPIKLKNFFVRQNPDGSMDIKNKDDFRPEVFETIRRGLCDRFMEPLGCERDSEKTADKAPV